MNAPQKRAPVCGQCGSDQSYLTFYSDHGLYWDDESQGFQAGDTSAIETLCNSDECDGGTVRIKWIEVTGGAA